MMKGLSLTIVILLALTLTSTSCTSTNQVAKVVDIYVSWFTPHLVVDLMPTDAVQAGKYYKVDLYEKGKLRATSTVSWSVAELNVKNNKGVYFPLTTEERGVYLLKDLSNIFSVKVHE